MKYKTIAVEGIDGAGKDTQINKLLSFFKEKNQGVEVVKMPDPTRPIGELIQRFLNKEVDFSPDIQFLLYATDLLSMKEQIQQWLKGGKTILFNRYITSTLAYQCGQGFPLEKGMAFIQLFDFLQPDIIFYLKISAATAVKRKSNQKVELDRFESKELLQGKIAEFYNKLIKDSVLGKWVVIDGEQSPEEVFEAIKKHL